VLLLWAEEDLAHPMEAAAEALDLLPDAQLRTVPQTGFLIAYDDPVAVARELISFCG
jgi:pimeloyl-ACP methyl ester carboxylesterase